MAAAVEARVREIISECLGVSLMKVTPGSAFHVDLGADYLDMIELVIALEQEYQIEISDKDAENFRTIQQAVDYIRTRHT